MEALGTFNGVMKRLDGRDKINTLIQECAKLTYFVLSQNKSSPEFAAQCLALGKGLSLCRSADRFLNSTIQFDDLIKTLGGDLNATVKIPKALIHFGYLLFFYYDNKIFLGLLGVLKGLDYADLGKKACKLWFYCIILTIFLQVLKRSSSKEAAKDEKDSLALAANCCDIVVAANGSGYIGGSDAVMHVLTIMSALLGIKKIILTLK